MKKVLPGLEVELAADTKRTTGTGEGVADTLGGIVGAIVVAVFGLEIAC